MYNRLRLIRKELGLTQDVLAQHLGIGKSALSMIETGKTSLSERNRKILVQKFNVNPAWLEGGDGSMFIGRPVLMPDFADEKYEGLRMNYVPLYDTQESGLAGLFSETNECRPIDYLYVPNLPKCDGAVCITGDGISSVLRSGDIVLYRRLKNIENIFWGNMYLLSIDVDGGEYVTVSKLYPSDKPGCVRTGESDGNSPSANDIPLNRIQAIAFVKASIRIHSQV